MENLLLEMRKPGLGRREFLGAAAAALFAGVVIQITGCGSNMTASVPAGSVSGTIDNNHTSYPHSVYISKVQLDAGKGVVLTLTGNPTHSHDVTLTDQQVVAIGAGTQVTVTSTSGGDPAHTHDVHFQK